MIGTIKKISNLTIMIGKIKKISISDLGFLHLTFLLIKSGQFLMFFFLGEQYETTLKNQLDMVNGQQSGSLRKFMALLFKQPIFRRMFVEA